MNYYSNLEEKEKFFVSGNLKVDQFPDLLKALEKFNNKDTLFRGQPEARFMLYSSLQRLWLEKNLKDHYGSYRELIDNLIHNCKTWNASLITKYLKNAGWEGNEMSILSIMQHYGVPTPLLDFTYDINKSLFFATSNLDFSPPNSEIEKYFSIYYIFKKNSVLLLSDKIIKKVLSHAKTKNVAERKDLDTTMQFEMALIDNIDEAFRIQNNLNILNQEGAFIFNSSPSDPLEIHYFKYVKLINRILAKHKKKIETSHSIGGCININKKLAREIREYLKEKGIDRYSMFPDLNQLRTDCLNMEWEKLSPD